MVKLSDIELPMIFKDRLLFSYGILNNWEIRPEEIEKSMINTKWEDQRTRSLFFAHNDRDAQKWVGRIANPHILNGELFGDLEIHDADLALKMGPGKAPLGISAEIKWSQQYNQPTDFSYRAFAVVHNPEVVETLVNFSEQKKDGFNTATFQIPFKETTNFSEDSGVVTSESAKGSTTEENAEPMEEDKEVEEANFTEEKESNLMSAERGFNEIKMEEKQENVIPEVKVVEEVKEEVTEIVKEEVIEEAKEEEGAESVEESKEADFAAFNDKFEKLVARVNALESKQAEFSEAAEEKSEEVEEEKVEEVEEVKEEPKEEVEEEEVEEEEVVEEESKEAEESEEVEESKEAEFSELAEKIDKLADAIIKKEAAPMSTAEFGTKGIDKSNDIIDRLTLELQK